MKYRLSTGLLCACAMALWAGCSFPTQDFTVGAPPVNDVLTDRAQADVTPDQTTPPPDHVPTPDMGPPDIVSTDTAPSPDMGPPPPDAAGCGTGPACAPGQTCCEGSCVDTQTAVAHCGRCGSVCDPSNASPRCVGGTCRVDMCDTGFADCDMNAANGCEISTGSDINHCGRCGMSCATTPNTVRTCAAGVCTNPCTPGFGDCDGNAANGCETDLRTSVGNCGMCRRACPTAMGVTTSCSSGECEQRCATGFGDCDGNVSNGCETSLSTSAANCGSCGFTCSYRNGTPACSGGVCTRGTCNVGFGDCDGNVANGCEANTSNEVGNCGTCGTRCSAGSACVAGRCSTTCSPAPLMMCGGACVDTSNAIAHCGTCDRACNTPNATPACTSGTCTIASCGANFANCNGMVSDGCEVNVLSDTSNCGGCRVVCDRTNGTASCVSGVCRIACNVGFENCDADPSDGCEVAIGTDPRNCGRCGNACSVPNATAGCVAGQCTVGTCTAGFANCDSVVSNGCEVNVIEDEANCGRCGNACARGQFCVRGICTTMCTSPLVACGTRCVNTNVDSLNCGACGRACTAGTVCLVGRCVIPPPVNDRCANATEINLSAGSRITLSTTTAGSAHDLDSPCDSIGGGDVFFRFTLTRRELVYADTFGTTLDTKLFFASSCTAPFTGSQTPGDLVCDDNAGATCTSGGLASQVYTALNPGTYFLVLSSNGTTGPVSIRFEHIPAGSGVLSPLARGISVRSGTTSGTTSGYASSCGGSGPEHAFWWVTCPESSTATTLTASTCGRATWNTVLSVVQGSAGPVCDDNGCPSTQQSILSAGIPAGSGVHALFIDGFGGAVGSYSLLVTRP